MSVNAFAQYSQFVLFLKIYYIFEYGFIIPAEEKILSYDKRIVIFVYYIFATLLPIDKLIGRIYPVFGFALLVMAVGVLYGIFAYEGGMPEITSAFTNHHPGTTLPIFPGLCITIACGAVSGFHATQSPMMARCIKNEKLGRGVFYGAMITEGLVAMIWAGAAIKRNHSACHLLQAALREVLGTHVEQKGSLVTPDSLRFDFSHFQKVTDEEIRQVEHLVNAKIRENVALQEYRNLPIEKAKELGAIALFGEKYGEEVRVIQFGNSIEFCGGTHVSSTGKIGMVRIISESSVAAGVRRIEAITGERVEMMIDKFQDTMADLKALFNNVPDLKSAIRKAIEENAGLKKQVEEFMKEKAASLKNELIANAKEMGGVKVIKTVAPISADVAKDIAFQLKGEIAGSLLVVIGSVEGGKPMLTVMLSEDLVKNGLKAGNLVKEAAKLIQGGGGGAPHFATAGGKNPEGLLSAVDKVIELAGL